MKDPRVSVVIPACNHERYVGEAIQSVLDQTFQDFELIIINDGSTDETEGEILRFKDSRLRYYTQANLGLSATLNRGIELARGQYFNFLPSDDAFLPEKLATQLKTFEESGDIGVVFSYHFVIDGEGKAVKEDSVVDWFNVPFETKEEIFPALFERDFLSAPTALVKMACFQEVGLFDESLRTAQDYDMWMRILKQYDLRLIKRPLLKMRWHGANLTYRATAETELERTKVLLKAYKNLKIEDIFTRLHGGKELAAYSEACKELATYMERSGIPALIPISQIYRERGRELMKGGKYLSFPLRKDGEEEEGVSEGGGERDRKKIHLLVETLSLDRGGLEEVIYGIVSHLNRDLFRPVVVCIEKGGATADRIRKSGVPVEILGEEKEKEYLEILRRYQIDLVNTHYSFIGSAIAARNGIPVTSVLHSKYIWYSGRILDEFRIADRYVSKYIAVSEDVASFSEYRFNIDRDRIAVIPDGIDISRFDPRGRLSHLSRKDLGLREEDFIFLHVGAVNPAKMHNLMVAAMKQISSSHPEIKLLCVGPVLNEDYYHFIQRRIDEYKLKEHVRFIGYVDNPSEYYKLSDAFLLPSLVEGWGIATLEAMYHGLPVILTRVGGAEKLIEDRDIGILIGNCCGEVLEMNVSDWDYYSHLDSLPNGPQLVEAMLEVYRNRKEWREKAKKGKKKVLSHYTWEKVVPRYEKEFVSLALEGRGRRVSRLTELSKIRQAQMEELERREEDSLRERENQRKLVGDQIRILQDQSELAKVQHAKLKEQQTGLEDQARVIQDQAELIRVQQAKLEDQEKGLQDQAKVIQNLAELTKVQQEKLEEQEKGLQGQAKVIQDLTELSKVQQMRIEAGIKEGESQKKAIEDQVMVIQHQAALTKVQQEKLEEQEKGLQGQAKVIQDLTELSKVQQIRIEAGIKEGESQKKAIEDQAMVIQHQEGIISEQLLIANRDLRGINDRLAYILDRLSIKERMKARIAIWKNRFRKLLRRVSPPPGEHGGVPEEHLPGEGVATKEEEKPNEQVGEPEKPREPVKEQAPGAEKETGKDIPAEEIKARKRWGGNPPYGIEKKGFSIICLPIIDWDFRFQRPQQILSQFASDGYRVFYVRNQFIPKESKNLSKTDLEDSIQIEEIGKRIYQISLISHHRLNIYQDILENEIDLRYLHWSINLLREKVQIENLLFYVNLPFWFPLVKLFSKEPNVKIVYDCMDYHRGFSTNTGEMVDQEEGLSRLSDLVITSSRKLYDLQKGLNPHSVLVRNGADFRHFNRPEPSPLMKNLKRPIIGYYGAISDWFDMDLVKTAALSKPDWNFVLIGYTFGANLEGLEQIPNIHLLGEKNYRELPGFFYWFDVCTIPFKINKLTEATNPVKIYEYLSAGKPAVVTRLPELEEFRPYVYVAEDRDDFIQKLEAAVEERDDGLREERVRFALENDWGKRYESISREVISLYKKVSIIVISYNNLEYLKLCLTSIFEYSNYPNYEVIVVDNGSKDGSADYLKGMGEEKKIVAILNAGNLGFAKGNNQGIEASSGEYIILLNDDTVVTQNWISGLLGHLNLPGVGMVGPVTNEIGNEAKLNASYSSLDEMREWVTEYSRQHKNRYFEIKMLALFCVVFRRSLLDEIGLLDERFEVGMFEDDDFSFRIKKAGYKSICAEDVFVHHFGKASFKKIEAAEYQRIFDRNKELYESKWNMRWEPHRYRDPVGKRR